jgi:hypothetical protein
LQASLECIDPNSRLRREYEGDVMDGPVTRQKDWLVRPAAVAIGWFFVAAMPVGHKSGAIRPAA